MGRKKPVRKYPKPVVKVLKASTVLDPHSTRVPFLDHRPVELMAAVPVPPRPEPVWDKQIPGSA